ncbi:MAG: hypothetical protein AAF585_05210 [Verrucomicrobiota bacterium]
MAEETAAANDEPPSLIFRWKVPRIGWRFPFFVFASLLAHVFAFYIFRVVNPPSVRVTPQPTRVMLLQPSDPDAARVLRILDDRAHTFGATESGDYGVSERAFVQFGAQFRPSFEGHEIALRDLTPLKADSRLPTLMEESSLVLPKSQIGSPPTPPSAADPVPEFRLDPQFEDRSVEWDGNLPRNAVVGLRIRALVGVRSNGTVKNWFLDDFSGAEQLPEGLAREISRSLRFEPSESEMQWGWVEVIW